MGKVLLQCNLIIVEMHIFPLSRCGISYHYAILVGDHNVAFVLRNNNTHNLSNF